MPQTDSFFYPPTYLRISFTILAFAVPSIKAQTVLLSSTLDSGGGTSTGGAYSLSGTMGQSDASAPSQAGTVSLGGGFWKQFQASLLEGYAAWAAMNVGAGMDASFNGDADGDGLPNGLHYIFGGDGIRMEGAKAITAPPLPVPSDVRLLLRRSTNLMTWDDILEYENGVQVFRWTDLQPTADGKSFTDLSGIHKAFYRYEATQAP